MRYIKKIESMIIIGMFMTTTFCMIYPIDTIKASEVDLDKNFIVNVLEDLTSVVNHTDGWMGRDFGSEGEKIARDRLENRWNNEIAQGIDDIPIAYPQKIDKGSIYGEEYTDGIDDRLVIRKLDDYSLKIKTKTIDKQSCFPVPILNDHSYHSEKEYKAVITPEEWYTEAAIESHSEYIEEDLIKQKILFESECMLLNDAGGLSGEIVFIEDYEAASINDTNRTIHLIEIAQNANDDVFSEIINKVNDSGRISFIAMTTNPSFINDINSSVPGVIVSLQDGVRIKQKIKNGDNLSVEFEREKNSKKGKLKVYTLMEDDEDYIYIISLKMCIDYFNNKYLEFIYPRGLQMVDHIWKKSKQDPDYPTADAFLIYDTDTKITDGKTHFMSHGGYGLDGDIKKEITTLNFLPIAGFITNYNEGSIIQDNDIIEFKINSVLDRNIDSYNVIGDIPGKSDDVVIVCGHFDSYWGQCAMDNAAGVASVWGVAKYFSENYESIKDELDYTLKFIAFSGEESSLRGSNFYVLNNISKELGNEEDVIAVLNIDTIAQKSTLIRNILPPIPFTPWIYPSLDTKPLVYSIIYNIIKQYKFESIYGFEKPHWRSRDTVAGYDEKAPVVFHDTGAFIDIDENDDKIILSDHVVTLERWAEKKLFSFSGYHIDDFRYTPFYDHRAGEDFTVGDVLSKVDRTDLYLTAKILLNLAKLFALKCCVNFNTDCTFTQQDLDSDGNYDSVKIGYEVTASNLSSLGNVEAVIYQNGQPKSTTFTKNLFNITNNKTTYGNLTVTLPPNVTAGNYNVKVILKDINGSQDDTDNSTIYLFPYNHSIANFTWELNDNNLKMVNFTDMSMPSPNAVLSSWNWSFGDGNYSNLQNCSHNYSEVGVYNVTLTVTDNANKVANITKQVETFNSVPVAIFSTNTTLVMVNNHVTFNSTSFDVDGSIINTTWYFGDNTTDYESDITHSFSESGYYNICVVVTDNDNFTESTWKEDYILVVDAMVDDGFTDNPSKHKWNSIQEGINDVNDNGTIYVYNGSYNPYLVNKSITIYGENKNGVSISTTGIGIDVQSHDIYIKNFTINGGTTGVKITSTVNGTGNTIIENGYIPGPLTYGVYIDNSTNNTIKNCEIEKADAGVKICNGAMYNVIDDCDFEGCYNGVGIYSSSFNWVGKPSIYDWYPNDCTFKLNTNAVYIDESDHNFILGCDIDADSPLPFGTYRGIYLDEASNTTISTCDIYEGTQGIYIKDSMDSKVEFCRIRENQMGVEFYGLDAKDNLIVQNNITGNTQFGVFIPAEPSNNSIYYNDFIANVNPGVVNQSHDDRGSGLMNIWEKSGNSTLTKTGNGEGNYWDDYTGRDLGSDGIGDTPYELDTISARVIKDDDYPLMTAYNWCTGTGWS